MSKELFIEYTSKAISKEEEMLSNAYQIYKKLENKLDLNDLKEILFVAEEFCAYLCPAPKNNPMVTCANNCPIWKLKNKALEFKGK